MMALQPLLRVELEFETVSVCGVGKMGTAGKNLRSKDDIPDPAGNRTNDGWCVF